MKYGAMLVKHAVCNIMNNTEMSYHMLKQMSDAIHLYAFQNYEEASKKHDAIRCNNLNQYFGAMSIEPNMMQYQTTTYLTPIKNSK